MAVNPQDIVMLCEDCYVDRTKVDAVFRPIHRNGHEFTKLIVNGDEVHCCVNITEVLTKIGWI